MKKLLAIVVLGLLFSGNANALDLIIKWETIVKHKDSGEEFYHSVSREPISNGFQDSKIGAIKKCASKHTDSSKSCLFKTYIYTYKSGKKAEEDVWEQSLATLEYWENQSKPKTVAKKPGTGKYRLDNCVYDKTWRLDYVKVDIPKKTVIVEYDKSSKLNQLVTNIVFISDNKFVKIRSAHYEIIIINILDGQITYRGSELYCEKINNVDTIYAAYVRGESDTLIVEKPKKKEPEKVVKKPKKKEPEKVVKKPKKKEPPKKQITKAPEIDGSLLTIGSGSGFYINNKGYALTNNHVVDICKQMVAVVDGREILLRVLNTDKINDVAVLKTDYKSRSHIKINEDGAKLGENVIAVGYPLAGRLSDSVKITRGIVSSLSGLDNNIGQIQIDAALQPGNSGGPVLNEKGELIGIASAGLNKLLMAKEAKYIPENVNFAVASPIVVNILKSKKIKYTTPSMFSGSYSNTELAELGDSSTIQLFCRNTRTAYNKLKRSNKYSTILLDLD